jgi:hypothetical protein
MAPHSKVSRSVTETRGGQDSAVGIVTGYGLDDLGIEPRWGQNVLCHQDRHRDNESQIFPRGKTAVSWCCPPNFNAGLLM